jgi:MFS family permease
MHHLYVNYLHHKELDDLYVSVFLKYLADSFVAIFIPVFFLINGFAIRDIALFALVHYVFLMILMTPFNQLGARIGVKKVMVFGTIMFILTYFLLNQITFGLSYLIAAFFSGVASASYWGAFHIDFTKAATNNKEGKNLSIIKIIAIITAALGPLIGSYLIELTSFSFVFTLASILLLISTFPLFFTKDFKVKKEKITIKKVLKADSFANSLAYQVQGATFGVAIYFWPAFIYITLNNVLALGQIFSLTSILTIFLILTIGKLVDKNTKKALKLGVYTQFPLWIIRVFMLFPMGFFIVNFFDGISRSLVGMSLDKIVYHKAEHRKNLISYFAFREYSLGIGRLIFFSAALLINNLKIIFVLCGFLSLLYLFLAKKINNKN